MTSRRPSDPPLCPSCSPFRPLELSPNTDNNRVRAQRDRPESWNPPSLPGHSSRQRVHHPPPILLARLRARRRHPRQYKLEIRYVIISIFYFFNSVCNSLSCALTDLSNHDFPGIYSIGKAFTGPRPNPDTHPHMRLEKSMISIPDVNPGDMVFWHCVRVVSCRVLSSYDSVFRVLLVDKYCRLPHRTSCTP